MLRNGTEATDTSAGKTRNHEIPKVAKNGG
jgi:hypothetical protein